MGHRKVGAAKMKRSRPGTSLIEALIAITIIGIAMLGLAELFLVSISNNTRGGEMSQATFLAQQQLDYLRTLTATELAEYPSTARSESADETIDMNRDGTLDFRRLTVVQGSGYAYAVRVLVFPAARIGRTASDLLRNPASYRALAVMHAVIGR
jgi:Tfp pilus assembly protein PilV